MRNSAIMLVRKVRIAAQMAHLVDCVRGGSGLLMIGGWESFHGRLGEYQGSPLAEVLPVVIEV